MFHNFYLYQSLIKVTQPSTRTNSVPVRMNKLQAFRAGTYPQCPHKCIRLHKVNLTCCCVQKNISASSSLSTAARGRYSQQRVMCHGRAAVRWVSCRATSFYINIKQRVRMAETRNRNQLREQICPSQEKAEVVIWLFLKCEDGVYTEPC